MLRGVKNGIGATFSIVLGVSSIVAIPWALINYWSSIEESIQTQIISVERATSIDNCDTPRVTILKDKTSQTSIRICGDLGRAGQICALIENRCE